MITIQSPYEHCPVLHRKNVELRLVNLEDAEDLLRCYSDPDAQHLFNADNCTNTFEYSTLDEMRRAIAFWLEEYQRKDYVRFSIVEKRSGHAIGTIEMFTKLANDESTLIGILRIDLQSSFETEEIIDQLVQIAEADFPKYFAYTAILIKVVATAEKRRKVLQNHGFEPLKDKRLMSFDDYYVKHY